MKDKTRLNTIYEHNKIDTLNLGMDSTAGPINNLGMNSISTPINNLGINSFGNSLNNLALNSFSNNPFNNFLRTYEPISNSNLIKSQSFFLHSYKLLYTCCSFFLFTWLGAILIEVWKVLLYESTKFFNTDDVNVLLTCNDKSGKLDKKEFRELFKLLLRATSNFYNKR